MKFQKIITLLCFSFLFSFSSDAQSKKYVGDWLLTSGPFNNKCAKDQNIILRKDGTATYLFGTNTEGCKGQTQNYKKWKVETRKFKKRKKNFLGEKKIVIIKKTALVIGDDDDIVFYIEKKKGKTMKVTTDVTSGDTTKEALITLKKRKIKKK